MKDSDQFERFRAVIDLKLSNIIGQSGLHNKLVECMLYATFPGGKRIRPALALALCSNNGGDPESILGSAVALELIHCASLIHDDLPALDNDDFRRGKPSAHKAFGEATAILAGDALPMLALVGANRDPIDSASSRKIGEVLSESYLFVCSGQSRDLDDQCRSENMRGIHREKTGSLFSAAVVIGMIGAGVTGESLIKLKEIGAHLGVAFQLRDDLIDHLDEKGRPAGSDLRNSREILPKLQEDLDELCLSIEQDLSIVSDEIDTNFLRTNKRFNTEDSLIQVDKPRSCDLSPIKAMLSTLSKPK